jgi:hypothetical protein
MEMNREAESATRRDAPPPSSRLGQQQKVICRNKLFF